MRKPRPAKTRRTAARLEEPERFDLVDVFEGQTPYSVADEYVETADRCSLHDRAFCRHCGEHGAKPPAQIGVSPTKWGPKKGEKGYVE